jgi:hypothetical protein
MLKTILTLIIIVMLGCFVIGVIKEDGFCSNLIKIPEERVLLFLEERKEVVEKEIEGEREKAEERVKEAGKSLWQDIKDYVFNLF